MEKEFSKLSLDYTKMVNKTERHSMGQYYTPYSIVNLLLERENVDKQTLLDVEDAESLNKEKIYDNSWAVIIGIDDYGDKPLKYAVDDAQAIYNILITDFGFKKLVYAIHCYLLWFPCLCLIVLYYVLYTFIK